MSGKNSIALSSGIDSKAKGALGCYIVLAEWERSDGEWNIKDVKCHKVDGKTILPDTLYQLKNGEFVVVEE